MSKISVVPLGEIIQFQRGFDLPTSQRVEGECPVISSSGFTGTHQEFKCEGENVITGRYGTIGEVYYYNGKCWPLNTSLFVKDFKGNIPQYVYYLLKHVLKVDGKDKSTVPGVDRNVLHMMKVSFHKDLIEQQKIVDVLSVIDKKIEVNNKIDETLQEQASLLYDYWFTQFDFPDETGRPYKSSGGKMVWNEQLKREIPEGWIVKPVSELLNVVTGKEDANFSVIKGKYKFFTCSKDALLCDEFVFDGKAILIAGNGDFNVKHYSGKFNAYQRTYVLIPENEKYYGTIYLAATRLINMFKTGSNGSIVKFITKDDVDNIMITIPNNDTYFEVINHIITTIESKQIENEELSALRDWLLPMLMNGQVTVE